MKIVVRCPCRRRRRRIIPILGLITEQRTAAVSTPQYQKPKAKKWRKYMSTTWTMTDSQQVTITIDPSGAVDKRGNPSPLPAGTTFEWTTDNAAVLALTPSGDGLSCVIAAVGPLSDGATVTWKATDPTGAAEGTGSATGTIVSGSPVSIPATVGQPSEQP